MQVKITPTTLSGVYTPPPSKSYAHRLFIAAALSYSPTSIKINGTCDDVDRTIDALRTLGATITKTDDGYDVVPIDPDNLPTDEVQIDCGESGTTLRLMIPLVAALGVRAELIGRGRLGERPIGSLLSALSDGHGVTFDGDKLPLKISGKLQPGDYEIDGSESSQFVSGMLFALSYIGSSKLFVKGEKVSESYIEITKDVLNIFDIEYLTTDFGYLFTEYCEFCSPDCVVCPPDMSQVCFFAVLAMLGNNKIILRGIPKTSVQGDFAIFDVLKSIGVNVIRSGDDTFFSCENVRPFDVSLKDMPDAAPALSILALACGGMSVLRNVDRLRLKESDRLEAIIDMLDAFGIFNEYVNDELHIICGYVNGGKVDGKHDHRIVMAATICASQAQGETIISDAEAVAKSYPDFFDDFAKLGGKFVKL